MKNTKKKLKKLFFETLDFKKTLKEYSKKIEEQRRIDIKYGDMFIDLNKKEE